MSNNNEAIVLDRGLVKAIGGLVLLGAGSIFVAWAGVKLLALWKSASWMGLVTAMVGTALLVGLGFLGAGGISVFNGTVALAMDRNGRIRKRLSALIDQMQKLVDEGKVEDVQAARATGVLPTTPLPA